MQHKKLQFNGSKIGPQHWNSLTVPEAAISTGTSLTAERARAGEQWQLVLHGLLPGTRGRRNGYFMHLNREPFKDNMHIYRTGKTCDRPMCGPSLNCQVSLGMPG